MWYNMSILDLMTMKIKPTEISETQILPHFAKTCTSKKQPYTTQAFLHRLVSGVLRLDPLLFDYKDSYIFHSMYLHMKVSQISDLPSSNSPSVWIHMVHS